ncbi:MAG: hypothetical protein ACK52I_20395 [Pseudomonadota bacterium]|jgi:hypothetical protein
MAKDHFLFQEPHLASPLTLGTIATPSDSNDLPFVTREVFFPAAGTVRVTWLGQPDNVFSNHVVLAGDLRAWRITRIWAAGTTVPNIEIFQ